MPSATFHKGLGRRKEAIATVRLLSDNKNITVNDKTVEEYFASPVLVQTVKAPLVLLSQEGKLGASVKVRGGGKRGQADAAKLGIARALLELDSDNKVTLRKAGYLTRDPREKERKKPGLKRARKSPQWKKR